VFGAKKLNLSCFLKKGLKKQLKRLRKTTRKDENEANYRNIELTDEGIIFKRGFLRTISSVVAYKDVETVTLNEKKKQLSILSKDEQVLSIKKNLITRSTNELHKIIPERVENAKAKLRWQSIPLQIDVLNQQIDELVTEGAKMNVCDLAELLLIQSVHHNASDIHIEPHQHGLKVRYRIDGFFHDIAYIPEYIKNRLISRIKVISRLVIYKHNTPQEGSIRLTLNSVLDGCIPSSKTKNKLSVDFRVSIIPTVMGEKIVIRAFDILGAPSEFVSKEGVSPLETRAVEREDERKREWEGGSISLDTSLEEKWSGETVVHAPFLESLGFTDDVLKGSESLILQNQGMIILTGPSGSGKTTTLYSALRRIHQTKGDSVSIVSIEDPVEYNLEVANQIQVDAHNGLTFAKTLASVLRQDPEVIMVGEIRDPETAEIAIQAGLTGHLVLTTVHCGTAAGVFTRLLDMGLAPFLVASSVRGVIAQRLVRVVYPDCRENNSLLPTSELNPKDAGFASSFSLLGSTEENSCEVNRLVGSPKHTMTNYKGRTAIAELLVVTDAIRELIMKKSTTGVIEEKARELGMQTLKENGLQKVKNGITTEEELIRVL